MKTKLLVLAALLCCIVCGSLGPNRIRKFQP